MMEQLRTIEKQLNHTLLVVDNTSTQLQQFQFQKVADALAQLRGELLWIQNKAKELLKESQP